MISALRCKEALATSEDDQWQRLHTSNNTRLEPTSKDCWDSIEGIL